MKYSPELQVLLKRLSRIHTEGTGYLADQAGYARSSFSLDLKSEGDLPEKVCRTLEAELRLKGSAGFADLSIEPTLVREGQHMEQLREVGVKLSPVMLVMSSTEQYARWVKGNELPNDKRKLKKSTRQTDTEVPPYGHIRAVNDKKLDGVSHRYCVVKADLGSTARYLLTRVRADKMHELLGVLMRDAKRESLPFVALRSGLQRQLPYLRYIHTQDFNESAAAFFDACEQAHQENDGGAATDWLSEAHRSLNQWIEESIQLEQEGRLAEPTIPSATSSDPTSLIAHQIKKTYRLNVQSTGGNHKALIGRLASKDPTEVAIYIASRDRFQFRVEGSLSFRHAVLVRTFSVEKSLAGYEVLYEGPLGTLTEGQTGADITLTANAARAFNREVSEEQRLA